MAQKVTISICILHICLIFSFTKPMQHEEIDLEIGRVDQLNSQRINLAPRPTLLIEQPTIASPSCLSKHLVLAGFQGACITGMIFSRDMPILMTMVGILEAIFLGIQAQQIHQDCKNIPASRALYEQLTHKLTQKSSSVTDTGSNSIIPFKVIQDFDYALSKTTNKKIRKLLYDTTILPTPPVLTEKQLLERRKRYFTVALCLKRTTKYVSKDIQLMLLAQLPELIYSKKQFCGVVPYVRQQNIHDLVTTCPITWFNSHYNSLRDTHIRGRFASDMAQAMCAIEIHHKHTLLTIRDKAQHQIPDQLELTNHLYHNYLVQLTAPPTQLLSNVLDEHHKTNNNLQM